jgi:hypothetical protein
MDLAIRILMQSNGTVPFDAMSFDPRNSFGPHVAATYDDRPRGDEGAAVARLAALAGEGPAMIEQLRRKPGGESLTVACGDMAVVEMPDRYRLVYIVYNSIMNLLTQDEQVRCVANAARHLTDDGVFVVENVVPDPMYVLRHDQDGVDQYVNAGYLGPDGLTIEVGRYDRVTQRVDKCHVTVGAEGVSPNPLALRYIWPAELDLMARLAGLRLADRWGGWAGEPFDGRSVRHVSVYRRDSVEQNDRGCAQRS